VKVTLAVREFSQKSRSNVDIQQAAVPKGLRDQGSLSAETIIPRVNGYQP